MQDDFYGMLPADVADEPGSLFREPGPFDDSTEPRDQMTELLGHIIWRHKGRQQAITIAELTRKTGRDARTVKAMAAELVLKHGLLVGGVRGGAGDDQGGYFIIQDGLDLEAACGPFEMQIEAMQKRVSRLRDLAAGKGIA